MSQEWIGILIAALPSLSAILGIIAALVKIRNNTNQQKKEVEKIAGEMKEELKRELGEMKEELKRELGDHRDLKMLCRSTMQDNSDLKRDTKKLIDEIRRIKRNEQE